MANTYLKEMAREREKRGKCLKCLKCLTVSLSHVELTVLYKLLYINILSFLLHLLFIL